MAELGPVIHLRDAQRAGEGTVTIVVERISAVVTVPGMSRDGVRLAPEKAYVIYAGGAAEVLETYAEVMDKILDA